MRRAAELIGPCRSRSPPVSTLLSEAYRVTTEILDDGVVPVAESTSSRTARPSSRQPRPIRPIQSHGHPQITSQHCSSSPSSTQQETYVYGAVLSTWTDRSRSRTTSMVAMTMAAPGATPLPWARLPPGCSTVRSFAASAADSLCNRSASDGLQEPLAEAVAAEDAARMVLEDPMSRLMASRGMPLGLSLRRQEAAGGGGGGGRRSEEVAEDADPSRPPQGGAEYDMEAFPDMLKATAAAAAAARRNGGGGAAATVNDGSGGGRLTGDVQYVAPSLDDSWGTTRESPADIARRIVESNLAARRDDDDDNDDDDGGPDHVSEGVLSPSEQKYASLEAMSADIKKLDEVFEVLASVPWLDEDVLAEKELKGVAQVGLLGTLEEVGFNVRHQLLRIWSGERGAELAAGPGLEFRDQAALLAILYHTQQIEERHGPPPRGYLPKPPTSPPQQH